MTTAVCDGCRHPQHTLAPCETSDCPCPGWFRDMPAEDETTDPRGDDACPECDEGTLVHTGRRHPAATQVQCDVCGFSS